MGLKLLIAGANGLVGQGCSQGCFDGPRSGAGHLARAQADQRCRRTCSLVRCGDFTAIASSGADLAGMDACLYCAGVLPVGMGEQAYRQVTVDATRAVAQSLRTKPTHRAVSIRVGAGANARSWLMPLKVKGAAEEAIKLLGWRTPICVGHHSPRSK